MKKILKKITGSSFFSLLLLYIVMLLIFTVWAKAVGNQFLKLTTFRNILQSLVVTSFLTIGCGCMLIGGNMDLSASAVGAFGGIVLASSIHFFKIPWPIAIILALVLCAIFGAFNALMITRFRFPAFIATLATASMAKGFMYLYSTLGTGGSTSANIKMNCDPLYTLGAGKLLGIPISVYIMILFFVVYGILISKTRLGVKICMLGGNPMAANMAGIKSTNLMFFLCINCSVLAGCAGIINASRLQQGALLALASNQFTGITAAILGGISFGGGKGNMGGAFLGLLTLNTFQIGMSLVGISPYWVNVFSGILLIIALTLDFLSISRSSAVKA